MSQTTKDYQYDRNDNNTFGVRGTASGGGGTEVVANPTLAGTESALTGLQVGETKYKVEQPINVVANPTLAGTESALTGIEVGATKYKNQPASVSYLDTAPSSANTDGLKFVVLTSEPATYYNGYYYIIAPTT